MIIAVTGHRPDSLKWGYDLRSEKWQYLYDILFKYLVVNKTTHCITGMALGVDTVFAFAALNYKKQFQNDNIMVECAIPCKQQEKLWSEKDQKHYNYILEHADKVTYVTNGLYKPSVMQKRNIYMVDKCDRLMAVWNGKKSGGTYNCIEYAKSVNKFIWRIDPSSI